MIINDAIVNATLAALGGTSRRQINGLLLAWYQDNGATANFINDAEYEFLGLQGAPTAFALNDRWNYFLGGLGYVGALSDRLLAFWRGGAVIGPAIPPGFEIGWQIGNLATRYGFEQGSYGDLNPKTVQPIGTISVLTVATGDTLLLTGSNGEVPGAIRIDVSIEGWTSNPVQLTWNAANSDYRGTSAGLLAFITPYLGQVRGVNQVVVYDATPNDRVTQDGGQRWVQAGVVRVTQAG